MRKAGVGSEVRMAGVGSEQFERWELEVSSEKDGSKK